MKRLLAASAALMPGVSPAAAESSHGYDPATHDGSILPAENLMPMVEAAMSVNPRGGGMSPASLPRCPASTNAAGCGHLVSSL